MAVHVARCTYVAVTEPLLYQLHLNSVGKEQTGTTVPQVMEAYLPQTVLAEHYGEVVWHIVGTYQLSHSVHTDVVLVLLAVASAECLESDVLGDNPYLETNKIDSEFHGVGLRSVRDIVNKYDGMMSFKQKWSVILKEQSTNTQKSGRIKIIKPERENDYEVQ